LIGLEDYGVAVKLLNCKQKRSLYVQIYTCLTYNRVL